MSHASSGGGNPLPMTVENISFLLDRLGQDCSPLQYLRELTQNAIEAIQRTGTPGQIVWDVDWTLYDLSGGPMRLCIVDTGDGMTGDEMIRFINQLSSSGSQQSFTGNYGVGAKIAAATKNPAGVFYQSWKTGDGYMVLLEKSPASREYGLRQWELKDGTYSHYIPLDDAVRPKEIETHGTKVILMGAKKSDSTIAPPADVASPSRWISKYLNTRYFQFPAGVTVKAREGWDNPRTDKDRNLLRTITGQKPYLDQHAIASGVEPISGAKVHWWILKDEPAISNNSGYIDSAGHGAALYQNELYDRATGRAGTALLQRFGILFGYRFVVLYVEPEKGQSLTTNTARTTLLLDGEKMPWEDWAYEFREKMPKRLAEFVCEKAAALTEKDHISSIKDRLKNVMDLYKVSRYRPVPAGVYLSDEFLGGPRWPVSVLWSEVRGQRWHGAGGRCGEQGPEGRRGRQHLPPVREEGRHAQREVRRRPVPRREVGQHREWRADGGRRNGGQGGELRPRPEHAARERGLPRIQGHGRSALQGEGVRARARTTGRCRGDCAPVVRAGARGDGDRGPAIERQQGVGPRGDRKGPVARSPHERGDAAISCLHSV